MNLELQAWVLNALLVFCRVGACLMFMPALSSHRLPMNVRLFFAVALSLALLPVIAPLLQRQDAPSTVFALLSVITAELCAGAVIGLLARIFFLSFHALLSASAQLIGFTGMGAGIVDDDQAAPEIATLFTLVATTLVFLSGLHWQLLRGLVDSYGQIPPGQWASPARLLTSLVDQLAATFVLALRITSPFFLYSVIVNFAVGLTNKLVPQIPVYFIAIPFVMAGGLILLYLTAGEMLLGFLGAFTLWATQG